MGVATSVKISTTLGGDDVLPKDADNDTPGMFPANSDHALREALRNLQLSPDMIDKSAAAIYAHVRDPVEHPVDKELARLCTSEYTRGALHALCLYLVAASSESEANGRKQRNSPFEAEAAAASTIRPAKGGRNDTTALSPEAGSNGSGETGNSPLIDSVSGKLSTFWNRMRRTRSMPAKGQGVILPIEDEGDERGREHDDGDGDGISTKDQHSSSCAAFPPRLSVRVGATPRTPRKGTSLLTSLGLGSPSGRAAGEVATPRRAPVRTGHWKLGHEIGKGSFGAVHIGLNEDTGDLIAVKQLSLRNADQAEELYTEIELMRQLTHPNIVCYLGAEVNDNEKTISIFQEWVPGSVTTLLVNFGPFSDRRIAGYTKQILQGLVYLHSERVIHRDIKGGNILIDDRGVVKLCDFGASKLLDADSFTGMGDHTRVGSPLFMAPEILLREDYGPQVDIWSLGGAVLEMATGQPPWHTLNLRTPVALINWVKRTEGPPPLPEGLSQPLTKFLLRCFERDPSKRASAKELLSDPFVAKRRGERPLFAKAGSDADSVVSDIDNLSRTAAIARIRRASVSDYSRPNSDLSARSVPSPRGSDIGMDISSAGGVGGSAVGGIRGDAGRGADKNQSPPRGERGSRGGSGAGYYSDLAQQVVAKLENVEDGGTPPRRPKSLQSRVTTPPLRVVTAGLEPPTAASPSSAPRAINTPPARRVSMGRNSPGTPNPFGGRRRSLDTTSPDGARSVRSSVSPRASPRASGALAGEMLNSASSQGNGGEGLAAAASSPLQNTDGAGAPAAAVAGADKAQQEDGASVHENAKGESNASPSAARRTDTGSSGRGSSSQSRDPRRASGGGSQEDAKTVDGDQAAPGAAAPVSDNVSPVQAGAERMEAPRPQGPLKTRSEGVEAPRPRGPVKTRSGRGERPGGRLSADTEAAPGGLALE